MISELDRTKGNEAPNSMDRCKTKKTDSSFESRGSYAPTLVQAEIHSNKVQPKHPLSVRIWESMIPKSMEKPPKLTDYDGKGDPNENEQLVDKQLNYFGGYEASKCKLFTLTLVGPTRLRFNDLPDGCIYSCVELHKRFSKQFKT